MHVSYVSKISSVTSFRSSASHWSWPVREVTCCWRLGMSCFACFSSDPCFSKSSWSCEFMTSGNSMALFNAFISSLCFKHRSFNFSTFKIKMTMTLRSDRIPTLELNNCRATIGFQLQNQDDYDAKWSIGSFIVSHISLRFNICFRLTGMLVFIIVLIYFEIVPLFYMLSPYQWTAKIVFIQ